MEPRYSEEEFFDVYNGPNLIKAYSDEKEADRRVFAENCSYRHKKDQNWSKKKRIMKRGIA